MGKQPARDESPLKDHYLALRLHPEADAVMIDQAYWHLARLYSAARGSDPSAKERLDDLNEAYSVLGSPEQREEYDRLRNAVLGEGALPAPPSPEQVPPPLSVLSKVQPRPRKQQPHERSGQSRFSIQRLLPGKLPSLPTLSVPKLRLPTIAPPHLPDSKPHLADVDTDALRSSTDAIRARLRAAGEHASEHPAPAPDEPSDPLL